MTFFSNLARRETWSIAADLNHIAHPIEAPTQEQISHQDPSFWDRLGGSILFALSLMAIVPGCLYLYCASRKIEQIDEWDLEDAEKKVSNIFEDIRPALEKLGKSREEKDSHVGSSAEFDTNPENIGQKEGDLKKGPVDERTDAGAPITSNIRLLGAALLAFGPHRNHANAQKELKILIDKKLLTPQYKSFLLAEAIQNNQIDKVDLLLNDPNAKSSECDTSSLEDKPLSNQEKFQLSNPIPLHQVKSVAMMQKLISLKVSLYEPVDDKQNTALHLTTSGDIARVIVSHDPHTSTKLNDEGNNPFHTCQNSEVLVALNVGLIGLRSDSQITSTVNARNKHGETPTLTMLTNLTNLIQKRDCAQTIQERNALAVKIQDLKNAISAQFTRERNFFGNNRNGLNALHLCAQVGDGFLLKEAIKCNELHSEPAQLLYFSATAVLEGVDHTLCDLALQRMYQLKERLKTESNEEIANELKKDLEELRSLVVYTSSSLDSTHQKNNNPLHLLVEMRELDLLKNLDIKKNLHLLISAFNKQNKDGETVFLFSLKNLQALTEIQPLNEIENEQLNLQIYALKEFLDFLLDYKKMNYLNGKNESIVNVNLQDNAGSSPLLLCTAMGDHDLLKKLLNHPNFDIKSLGQEINSKTPLLFALEHLSIDLQTFNEMKGLREAEEKAEKDSATQTNEKQSNEIGMNENLSELEKHLKPRIEAQKNIAKLLFSKACASEDPELLDHILEKIFKEYSLEFLDFLQDPPPLQSAFQHMKVLKESLKQEENKQKKAFGQRSTEKIDSLKIQLENQKKIIDVLIKHNLTKSSKDYLPIFDVLEENNPEQIIKLLNSKDFDINTPTPSNQRGPFYHEGPLYLVLDTLGNLKERYINRQKGYLQSPSLESIEAQIKNQEEILQAVLDKNPILKKSHLSPCIMVLDSFLLKKILRTEGVNANPGLHTALRKLEYFIKNELAPGDIDNLREIIHILIDSGADIPSAFRLQFDGKKSLNTVLLSEFKDSINKPNNEGRTPLQSSLAYLKSLETKKENFKKEKVNPLIIATEVVAHINEELKIIKALIAHGADQSALADEEKDLLAKISS